MIEKLKTAIWFAQRPNHWAHATELAKRKFRANMDGPDAVNEATAWAAKHAQPVKQALSALGISDSSQDIPQLNPELLEEAALRAESSKVTMGGPGDLNLLYATIALSGAKRVIETGVAYGWSSLATLSALEGREGSKLISVDMPYPKMNNEDYVGIVVPERLRENWEVVRLPDRKGLEVAIAKHGQKIDLCHYDSDKSWWGRQYGFPLLWAALKPDGIFISDDIQDNMGFAKFAEEKGEKFAVTESDGKYVGIIKKSKQ